MTRRRTLIAGGTVVALVAALGMAQLAPGAAPTAHAEGLVPYDSCSDLLNHYRDEIRASATPYGFGYGYGYGIAEDGFATAGGAPGTARMAAAMPQAAAGAADKAASSAGGMEAVGNGATGTNVQEQGVDEPDIAKLRDGRLVVVTQGRLQVVTAEAKPKLVGSLRVTHNDDQTYGSELLLVDDRALLVVPGWRQPTPASTRAFRPGTPTTKLVLLDLSTDQPRLIEEATYDAQYVSARLVDGTVRLVTSTRPQLQATYPQRPGEEPAALAANLRAAGRLELNDVLPHVVRTAADGTALEDGTAVSCDQTSHAVTPVGASTLLVTTLRPGSGLAPTDNDAVTTDGALVYASADRLYVATSRWGTVAPAEPVDDKPTTSDTAVAT